MKPRQPKERALPLTTDMVTAVLDGSKTVCRFPIKPQPPEGADRAFMQIAANTSIDTKPGTHFFRWDIPKGISAGVVCPWGQVGDTLWVQETFGYDIAVGTSYRSEHVIHYLERDKQISKPWRSSTQMTRKESRIILEITKVCAQRLYPLSDEEAAQEGYKARFVPRSERLRRGDNYVAKTPKELWLRDWNEKYWKAPSLCREPWVWVIHFKRLEQKTGEAKQP